MYETECERMSGSLIVKPFVHLVHLEKHYIKLRPFTIYRQVNSNIEETNKETNWTEVFASGQLVNEHESVLRGKLVWCVCRISPAFFCLSLSSNEAFTLNVSEAKVAADLHINPMLKGRNR